MRRLRLATGSSLWVLLWTVTGWAASLQGAYDAAGPGQGYDRLVSLEAGEVYTGGLMVDSGARCCIHGNGAVVDLAGESIWAGWFDTVLDVDHCVLTNGYAGITISDFATGSVRNNTICGNRYGVRAWNSDTSLVIENNIIAKNSIYGIYCREFFEPVIQYNDVWENPAGNYIRNCG